MQCKKVVLIMLMSVQMPSVCKGLLHSLFEYAQSIPEEPDLTAASLFKPGYEAFYNERTTSFGYRMARLFRFGTPPAGLRNPGNPYPSSPTGPSPLWVNNTSMPMWWAPEREYCSSAPPTTEPPTAVQNNFQESHMHATRAHGKKKRADGHVSGRL